MQIMAGEREVLFARPARCIPEQPVQTQAVGRNKPWSIPERLFDRSFVSNIELGSSDEPDAWETCSDTLCGCTMNSCLSRQRASWLAYVVCAKAR